MDDDFLEYLFVTGQLEEENYSDDKEEEDQ